MTIALHVLVGVSLLIGVTTMALLWIGRRPTPLLALFTMALPAAAIALTTLATSTNWWGAPDLQTAVADAISTLTLAAGIGGFTVLLLPFVAWAALGIAVRQEARTAAPAAIAAALIILCGLLGMERLWAGTSWVWEWQRTGYLVVAGAPIIALFSASDDRGRSAALLATGAMVMGLAASWQWQMYSEFMVELQNVAQAPAGLKDFLYETMLTHVATTQRIALTQLGVCILPLAYAAARIRRRTPQILGWIAVLVVISSTSALWVSPVDILNTADQFLNASI